MSHSQTSLSSASDRSSADKEFFLRYDVFNFFTKRQNLRPVQLKAFGDYKINVPKKLKIALERVENIVGKRENAGYQHFLHFQQCLHRVSFQGRENQGLFGKGLIETFFAVHSGKQTVPLLRCLFLEEHSPISTNLRLVTEIEDPFALSV